jgi:predicted peroxiredoxin
MSNDDLGVKKKEREKLKERGVRVFVYLLKQSVRACVRACVCVCVCV